METRAINENNSINVEIPNSSIISPSFPTMRSNLSFYILLFLVFHFPLSNFVKTPDSNEHFKDSVSKRGEDSSKGTLNKKKNVQGRNNFNILITN